MYCSKKIFLARAPDLRRIFAVSWLPFSFVTASLFCLSLHILYCCTVAVKKSDPVGEARFPDRVLEQGFHFSACKESLCTVGVSKERLAQGQKGIYNDFSQLLSITGHGEVASFFLRILRTMRLVIKTTNARRRTIAIRMI